MRDDQCEFRLPIGRGEQCGQGITDFLQGERITHQCVRKSGHAAECVCNCGAEWGRRENAVVQEELKLVFGEAIGRAAKKLGILSREDKQAS